jgi:hypothetical protein
MQGEAPRRPHTLIKLPFEVNEELTAARAAKTPIRASRRNDRAVPRADLERQM